MIAGPDLFDMVMFLGCLLAMFMSTMPKKFAISVCLGVSLLGILINTADIYGLITIRMTFSLSGIVELLSALGLILYSRAVINFKDRVFFMLMAMFLLCSSAINVIFIPIYLYTDYFTFGAYQAAFYSIAALHVSVMLGYSDGIRTGIANIRGVWVRNYAHNFNR